MADIYEAMQKLFDADDHHRPYSIDVEFISDVYQRVIAPHENELV